MGGIAASNSESVELLDHTFHLKGRGFSAAKNATESLVHPGSAAAQASDRRSPYRSHLAHNAVGVSPMRKAELAARQDDTKTHACF